MLHSCEHYESGTIFQQLQRDYSYILPKLLSSVVSPHFKQNEQIQFAATSCF